MVNAGAGPVLAGAWKTAPGRGKHSVKAVSAIRTLFLLTSHFWGHLTTGFENNIVRGWLCTNTKQIPQWTGSCYSLSAVASPPARHADA